MFKTPEAYFFRIKEFACLLQEVLLLRESSADEEELPYADGFAGKSGGRQKVYIVVSDQSE